MPTVFTKDILFLHVPKAGGSSVTRYLLRVLPQPVHYVHSVPLRNFAPDGFVHVLGRVHLSMDDAEAILSRHDIAIERMPLILAVLRNPYDLAVSLFSWFRRVDNMAHDGNPLRDIALHGTFREFIIAAANSPIDPLGRARRYFYLRGTRPSNLRIVRFEDLNTGVRLALQDIGLQGNQEMPHAHKSSRDAFPAYYDSLTEEIVFAKNRWMFEQGFFDRLRIG